MYRSQEQARFAQACAKQTELIRREYAGEPVDDAEAAAADLESVQAQSELWAWAISTLRRHNSLTPEMESALLRAEENPFLTQIANRTFMKLAPWPREVK